MDPYGINSTNPLDSPYGLTVRRMPLAPPVPSFVPAPPRPVSLSPLYASPGATGRMARQMQPMLTALAGMTRTAADVLPFRPVRMAADIAQGAATESQKTAAPNPGATPITPEQLANWIKRTESSGNYTALNRERPQNTASGAYGYTDGTWNGYGGYAKAMYAPREVQDRRFAEDISRRMQRYGGDPFKAIAEHYLPAYANKPETWNDKVRLGKQVVSPVSTYIRKVIRGTPLEAQFNGYLARHQGQ